MSTYLLTWKPEEWGYEKLRERLDRFHAGETAQRWSCGRTKTIPSGSRVFLTKQGKGARGIFGSGYVQLGPFEEPHFNEEKRRDGKTSLYVVVDFDQLYDPTSQIKIDRSELEQIDSRVWDSQGSGKRIPDEAASKLETLWRERTGGASIPYPEESEAGTAIKEGAVTQVLINSYERNPEARERCIAKWGSSCAVCGFHFEYFYGELGKGYIHVHHLTPLSAIRQEYELDPVKDLRPVCPNCHSMIHRRSPPLSIEELENLVRTYGRRVSK